MHQAEGTHRDDLGAVTSNYSSKLFRRIASLPRLRRRFLYEVVPMTRKSTPAEMERQ
jgi:hypothetical protein